MFNFQRCSIKLNDMGDRTRQQGIKNMMTQLLAEFAIELHVERWTSDETAIVRVSRRGHGGTYWMAWLPHATLSEVARLDQDDRLHPLLVLGPHISSRTAVALRDAHIDYVDYAGNAHLEFGSVLINIQGRRRPPAVPSVRTADANLFSAKRMQVIFALLAWPDIATTPVRSIANAAGTSVGITQSTLDLMREADYLIERSLQNRDELLDLWTAAFRGSLLPKIVRASYAGTTGTWSPPPGYLVSGESAVELIRQPQTLTIYVENFDIVDAVNSGWRKSDKPNIQIRQKFWEEPLWAVPQNQQGTFIASAVPPLLVYADLIASKEPRQLEIAATLRREQLV